MEKFVLYGLSRDDEVLATEQFSVDGPDRAREIARGRLVRFPKVELWQASICLLRRVRNDASVAHPEVSAA